MRDIKKAAALSYHEDSPSRILAVGREKFAFAIIQKAKEYNIPIFQNKELVDSLVKLDENDTIDTESCLVIAKILQWLSDTENNVQLSKYN